MFAILNRSNSKVMFFTKSFRIMNLLIPQFAQANDIDLHKLFATQFFQIKLINFIVYKVLVCIFT